MFALFFWIVRYCSLVQIILIARLHIIFSLSDCENLTRNMLASYSDIKKKNMALISGSTEVDEVFRHLHVQYIQFHWHPNVYPANSLQLKFHSSSITIGLSRWS